MPGHIYPLRARDGGVLVRAGQTEAQSTCAGSRGSSRPACICEMMNPDGTMTRLPAAQRFARKHNLKIISVAQLIRYRMQRERLVERVAETMMPTKYGEFKLYRLPLSIDPDEHVALVTATSRRRSRCSCACTASA